MKQFIAGSQKCMFGQFLCIPELENVVLIGPNANSLKTNI